MIILDTNVVSEPTRPTPSELVHGWIQRQHRSELFTTAVTEAEAFYGVRRMPEGKKRRSLEEQTCRLFEVEFAGRVLPFDSVAAREFAEIVVERKRMGRPILSMDAQIAAIARSRGAAVATRDAADFEHCGIEVINPWTA